MSDFQIIGTGWLPDGTDRAGKPVHGRAPEGERSRTGLLSVIGKDDRQRIRNTGFVPWRMICALRIHAAGGTSVGTGWMIGPRTVLTAGHCILHDRMGALERIEVIAGRDGEAEPHGRIEVPAARTDVHPRWRTGREPDRDVGVLHLDTELGRSTGWFATAMAADEALEGVLMNVAGYPYEVEVNAFGEQLDPPRVIGGRELWWNSDGLSSAEDERIFYATDTSGGQSGGPVWTSTDQGGMPIGLGIHAYGIGRASVGDQARNSAVRIDQDLADRITDWIDRSGTLAIG